MIIKIINDFLKKWIIPESIYEFIRSVLSKLYGWLLLLNKNIRLTLRINKKFKNIHEGERCFIVANGPSIIKQNILPLKNEHVFFINKGWRHKDYKKIKPEYYCIPKVEESNKESIRWLKFISKKILKNTSVFLSYYDKNKCEKNKIFQNNTYFIIHHGSWKNFRFSNLNIVKPIPTISNSPMMCIQIAIYMGFKEIYLLGTDYDFLTHYGKSTHFYKEKTIVWHDIWGTYEDCVKTFLQIMNEYRSIKLYSERRGIKIYNATLGGYLEVFRRKNLNSLFVKQ